MRLHDIEEKLQPLAQRRWGEAADVRVELDEHSGRLWLGLPDGREIVGPAPDEGALLTTAYSLLARYLERIDPWLSGDGDVGATAVEEW